MPIDWAATGAWMQAWAGFAGAGAVAYAAYVGSDTYGKWLKQKQAERKLHAAEQALLVAHKVKSALSGVRSPFMSGGELAVAEDKLTQDAGDEFALLADDRKANCIAAQAIINRYVSNAPVWEELSATRSLAYAFLGDNVEQALIALARQAWVVRVAADSYSQLRGDDDPEHAKRVRRNLFENIGMKPEDDEVGAAVTKAIEDIEAAVRPILKSED